MDADVITPGYVEWTLRNGRRREERTYQQTTLAIEGEVRLVAIARKVGAVLGDAGYTFGQLGEFFDETRDIDWVKAMTLLEHVSLYAPDLLAETATVYLGIFPTNEDGTRNDQYDDDLRFLRGAINVTKFADMTRVFMEQNEYARLVAPFSQTLSETMAAYGRTDSAAAEASSEPSEPDAIVGMDGSTVLLDLDSSTPTGGEPTPSEPGWPPKDSSTPTSTPTDEPQPSAPETTPDSPIES